MSGGIFAVWRLDGAPLESRGFDAAVARFAAVPHAALGAWRGGSVGLVYRRVHRVASAAAGPIRSADGQAVAVVDARIDNRDDVRARLGLAPGVSDARLVLAAWERWEEEAPAHLLGDFAYAIWDGRRQRLWCARDHFGVRPFYYHAGPGLFACASDTRPLIGFPGIPRELDEVRLASFLVPGFEERTRTFFAGIARLPAGHRLTVSPSGAASHQYWAPDAESEAPPATDAAYAEQFRGVLDSAVAARAGRGTSLAAALSGGLDSSSVVCLARAQRGGDASPLVTYSARFPGLVGCDEGAYIEAVAAQGGLERRELRGDLLDPLGEIETGDLPVQDALHGIGYYLHAAMFRRARHDGVSVFLEGTSGDAVVWHGVGYLRSLASGGRWVQLVRELARFRGPWPEPWPRTFRAFARQIAPQALVRAHRRLVHRGVGSTSTLHPDFVRRIDLDERLRAATPAPIRRGADGTRLEQWRVLTSEKMANILETQAAFAAGTGLDVRDPFTDRRLVDFCLSLPTAQKLRDGRTRVVMRRAMGDLLPAAVLQRRGKGRLHLMLHAALDVYGAPRLAALMQQAERVLAPYVTVDSVRRAHAAWVAERTSAARNRVWRLAALTLWLERQSLRVDARVE